MNFTQAITYIETLQKEDAIDREWDLQGIEELLKKRKHPEKRLGTIIHVTGTNGKGSVCAMLANILKVAGYSVGLYTSPHLSQITERIRINGQQISKEDFAAFVQRIRPFVTTQSFFEVMTAIAFLYFAEQKIDFCILEVGMGGRLDATNVVESTISVITNISLEHTQRLGKTEKQIAAEKAGIVKEDSICVTAATGEALTAIEHICADKNTQLVRARTTDAFELSLHGEIQKENAGVVLAAVEALKKKGIVIPKVHIVEGLRTTQWPGRLEFIDKNILVDVAHNPGGMEQLSKEIREMKKIWKNVILVIGILGDKEWKVMLDEIVPVADTIIVTKPNNSRAADLSQLQRYLDKAYGISAEAIDYVPAALDRAKHLARKDDLIVVTGSFYTVGEIYKN